MRNVSSVRFLKSSRGDTSSKGSISITGSNAAISVGVLMAPKGIITGLTVIGFDGSTPLAFTAKLFDSKAPYPVAVQNAPTEKYPRLEYAAATPAVPETLYQVGPTWTASSGIAKMDVDKEYEYCGRDGTPANRERYLYLLITGAVGEYEAIIQYSPYAPR